MAIASAQLPRQAGPVSPDEKLWISTKVERHRLGEPVVINAFDKACDSLPSYRRRRDRGKPA